VHAMTYSTWNLQNIYLIEKYKEEKIATDARIKKIPESRSFVHPWRKKEKLPRIHGLRK